MSSINVKRILYICMKLVSFICYLTMTCDRCSGIMLESGVKVTTAPQELSNLQQLVNATYSKSIIGGMKQVRVPCPTLCKCSQVTTLHHTGTYKEADTTIPRGTILTCTNGLKNIPNLAPYKIVSLLYTFSCVPNNTLRNHTFLPFRNVTTLILSNNNIKFIETGTFLALKQLRTLNLDNNPIVRFENAGFLNRLPLHLEVFSLCNISAHNNSSQFLWNYFGDNMAVYPHLHTLRLDRNQLSFVDTEAMRSLATMASLKVLGLSGNSLNEKDTFSLLNLISEIKNSDYNTRLNNATRNQTKQERLPMSAGGKNQLRIDLRSNNITVLNISILHLFITSADQEKLALNQTNSATKAFQLKVLLGGNPINCSCSAKPLIRFLVEGSGKRVIEDWSTLACNYPAHLSGVSLNKLYNLPRQICKEHFELSAMQIVFIVICTIVLSAVSITVGYLNRRKIVFYWNLIRNCGEDEDYQASVKWRNNIDKYSIPNDHRGVGHQGYYSNDEAVTFCKSDEN